MAETITGTRSQFAVQFLQLVTAGRIDEAYQKYVDMNGKHHNCYFPAGFPALKKAMIDNHKQFPAKKYTVKNVIGEGNMVAVHAHLALKQDDNGMVVVHICRFEGDKIVEFWDCGQAIPADMPNNDGAF
jgi:predicted SnoaL-like aldol condensation-catalyzing enzyme